MKMIEITDKMSSTAVLHEIRIGTINKTHTSDIKNVSLVGFDITKFQ